MKLPVRCAARSFCRALGRRINVRSLMGIKVEGICTLLEVFDMPTSVAFYRDVLGFEVVKASQPGDDFDWGLLRLGDTELMLNTLYQKHDRPTPTSMLRSLAA
jgi:hypothetical protein